MYRIKKVFNLSDMVAIVFFCFGIGRIDNDLYRPILLLIGMIWCFLKLPILKTKRIFSSKMLISYLLFISFYSLFIPIGKDISTAIGFLGSYLIYMILFIMSTYYIQKDDLKKNIRICNIIIIWIIILCVLASIYYIKHPAAARLYISHRGTLDGLMIGGGYQLAYACALLMPILFWLFFKKTIKIFYIWVILIMVFLMIKTTSMLTIIASIIGCYVQLIINNDKAKRSNRLILGVSIIFAFFIVRIPLGEFLLEFSAGKTVTNMSNIGNSIYVRINEIGSLLLGGAIADGNVVKLRVNNFFRPFADIIARPITGSLFISGVCPTSSNFNDSTLITAVVTWGLPLAILNLYPIFFSMKKYKRFIGSVVCLIIILLTNPSEGFSVYCMATFILPVIGIYINRLLES